MSDQPATPLGAAAGRPLPQGEGVATILARRAQQLAQPAGVGQQLRAAQGERRDALGALPKSNYLWIRIGASQQFGVLRSHAQAVLQPSGVVPVPGTPAHIRGILHSQGRMLSVLDLSGFFGAAPPSPASSGPENPLARVLLLRGAGLVVGLWVDDILGEAQCQLADLAPPLAAGGGAPLVHVLGIHRGQVAVLNIDALLADPRLRVDDSA